MTHKLVFIGATAAVLAVTSAWAVSNAIRNCPLCVMKNCPHPWVHDLG